MSDTPETNKVFGAHNKTEWAECSRRQEQALHRANEILAHKCGCMFTSGGFHKATCDFHERLQKRLAEAEDRVAMLSQKR